MQASTTETSPLPLEDILITSELHTRRVHPIRFEARRRALQDLGATLGQHRLVTLRALSDLTLAVCGAGSAGVSMLRKDAEGGEFFSWDALSGVYRDHVGGTTPRDFSPCGTTLDCGTPQLFHYPGRRFQYFNAVQPPIVEGLVIPIVYDRVALGTLWIVSHDEQQQFTRSECEVMQSLVALVAAALIMVTNRAGRQRPQPA
jgi:GAF domain-containing protein